MRQELLRPDEDPVTAAEMISIHVVMDNLHGSLVAAKDIATFNSPIEALYRSHGTPREHDGGCLKTDLSQIGDRCTNNMSPESPTVPRGINSPATFPNAPSANHDVLMF